MSASGARVVILVGCLVMAAGNAAAGTATSIVAGKAHTCSLTTGGGVLCWGENSDGQLGDGTTTSRSTPTGVSGLGSGVTAVTAGRYHTCALTTGGSVACWGWNSEGQLGNGTTTTDPTPTPTEVSGLESGVAAIAAGHYHTCALTTGGGVLCWGYNFDGQIGDDTNESKSTPTAVIGLESGVVAVSAGGYHTCALTTGGGVLCWGLNSFGALGDGTTTQRSTPAAVSELESGVASVTAGYHHTCALTTAGAALCWGWNGTGQLGDGTTTDQLIPTAVEGLESNSVTALVAGRYHTCAVTTGGGVSCWGDNEFGQLGDGTLTGRSIPAEVDGLGSAIAAVAAGHHHTCAVTTGGSVLCWGNNESGQLGLGTLVSVSTPLATYGFGGAIAVSSLTPGHGSTLGGTTVTITGAYFLDGATVTIGGSPATGVSVLDTETILATTGPHAAGAADVVVTNPDATQATVAGGFTYAAAGSDFSGDGKSDIVWHHTSRGEVWLWGMDGASSTGQTHVRTVAEPGWAIRGVGDYTGDGKADLVWRNSLSGMLYLWTMNGSTVVSETYVGTVDPAYDIVGTGDYDGDGKADLLWRQVANGELWVWLMNGATPLSQTYIETVDPGYVVQGSGDLNGDGKSDLVWRHATGGDVWVWLMTGTTPTVSYVDTVAELDYRIVGIADLTGDGQADILWHHATRGEVWLWPMNGTARVSQTYVDAVPDTGYQIVGAGDYNGDGKADLLWHHDTRGEVWVWLMNGAAKLSETYVGVVPEVEYQIVKVK